MSPEPGPPSAVTGPLRPGPWLRAPLFLLPLLLALGPVACGPVGGDDERPWSGEQVVAYYCVSCHRVGINGAPRIGAADEWAPRLAAVGREGLLRSTVAGIAPAMPSKGLCRQCTEQELAAAIEVLISGEGAPDA